MRRQLAVPTLSTRARPQLGGSFLVCVGNVPANPGITLLAVGASHTSWSGIPLPVNLQALAMPGCWSLTSFDLGLLGLLPQPLPSYSVLYTLTLPATPSAAGARLFLQGLAFDGTMPNAFGATVSNGLEFVLGN